ncbi:hypothetical protein [Jannaschia sp. LMIT008]|uniref:hypothetical protein n=1 Tax=Jannaschia maritima TaxID=3032585 RepID=UPI0028128D43|nr:hypothetical protein [Jannaschia sp. LMIT008]
MTYHIDVTAFFEVGLTFDADGANPCVDYVQVTEARSVHMVQPRIASDLNGVMDVRLAEHVRAVLASVDPSRDGSIAVESDFTLGLVALGPARVTVAVDGPDSHVTVRFDVEEGDVRPLLRSSAEGLRSTLMDIAIDSLGRTFSDATAVVQARAQGGLTDDARLHGIECALQDRIEAMRLRLGLLDRYVSRADAIAPAALHDAA